MATRSPTFAKCCAANRAISARSPVLGLILQDLGDDKQALEVYRRALAVYPRLQRIPDVVKELQQKVEGRDI